MGTRPWTIAGLLLVASYLVGWASAYSRGAPDSACNSLTPGHGGSSQSNGSPFSLTPSAVSVEPGQRMLLTLESTTGTDRFMGFIVQARDAETDSVLGTFFTTDHKYLTCGPGFNNAVTHGGGTPKGKVVLEWEPKSDFQGDIVFKGSFVKDYSTYWVGVTSEKVTVVKREASPPPSEAPPATTTQTPVTTQSTTAAATITTPAAPAAVPSDPTSVSSSPGNLGDLVITEIDGPQVDAGINSLLPDTSADVPLQPTPTPPVAPSSSTSPSTPPPPPPPPISTNDSSSSTISDNSIISTERDAEEVVTEAAVSRRPSTNAASAGAGGRGDSKTTKRKGLLGGFRPRATDPPPTTIAPTTEAPKADSGDSSAPIENSIASAMESIYWGCGSNKGCFGLPDKCTDIGKQNCDFLMTYAKSPPDNGYRFEILGDIKDGAGFVAGGLSYDTSMGEDSVMICRTENEVTDVLMAWNEGKSNSLLEDTKLGISNEITAFVDGRVYCSFIREVETEILGNIFNLDDNEFNLMVASGGVASGSGIGYHTAGRTVSGGQVNLGDFDGAAAKSNLFKYLHGAFMIGAWICAASLGMLMARYFKQTWLRSDCCKVAQWFHWHRFLMGLTWLLTMFGFGFMVYRNGISPVYERPLGAEGDNPHVLLGFISTVLCFIQPFMAMLRCGPQSRKRPIFNWLHWFVGNSAQIIGIAAVFFGLQFVDAPTWTIWILIIFVAFHCLVHLILSIGQCVSDSKAENSSNVFPMKDMNGSRNPLHPVDQKSDAPGGTFRKTMLTFYIIVNICITAALILVVYPGAEVLKEWGIIFWEE